MRVEITFGAGGAIGISVFLCGGVDSATNAASANCYMLFPDRAHWRRAAVDMTSGDFR